MEYQTKHIDGGEYSAPNHVLQWWYRYKDGEKYELHTSKFVMLKSGKNSKKVHEVFVPYSGLDVCPCCKRLTKCNYHKCLNNWQILKEEKEHYKGDDFYSVFLCKSCNMKFLALENQFDVLSECFSLLVQMRREIRNAYTNSRSIKRVPMLAIVGD